ncbi:exonuclease [Metabacillus litoralis]|uniref:Exonuclease n=1 Tax=Metabacillus litoralis TaxID=152268 RepID=A0A5C6VZG7_9BACI|nr:3'-5' exonuclease [Metabacillus litoralis]TXC90468.1 exonuclease [Metabacillus litoralis]
MAGIKYFVFFDFEMLCSDKGMPYEKMEAIRLGAVKYDLETKKIDFFDQFIKPKNSDPLSEFCKTLTGIQDEQLANAHDFKSVFEDFVEWIGGVKKARYFSWSTSDLSRLKFDSIYHEIPPRTIRKIENNYIDFQATFKKRVAKRNVSVEDALSLYSLPFIGEAHNPMYDAYNTLRIYLAFLNQPIESDIIMLKQFIFNDENDLSLYNLKDINFYLAQQLVKDSSVLNEQLRDLYRLKDVKKLVKPLKRMAEKYQNIVVNRSGLFTEENIASAEIIITLYDEILFHYEEHLLYQSKIVMFHDHLLKPLNKMIEESTL